MLLSKSLQNLRSFCELTFGSRWPFFPLVLRLPALLSLVRDVVDSQSTDMSLEAVSFFKWCIIINLPGYKELFQVLVGSQVCF